MRSFKLKKNLKTVKLAFKFYHVTRELNFSPIKTTKYSCCVNRLFNEIRFTNVDKHVKQNCSKQIILLCA